MTGPVLMFGNVEPGTLMDMLDPSQEVRVMVPPRMSLARWDGEDPMTIMPRTVIYVPRRLLIFGTEMVLHVEEGLAEERFEAMLRDHLLSDKAKAVMR